VGVEFPDDLGLISVAEALGLVPDAVLGHGGEAWVFALGDDRVVRILHKGGRAEQIVRRQELVAQLSLARPPFALPEVLDVGDVGGRAYAVERRLPGRAVAEALGAPDAGARRRLVERYMEAAAALGDLSLDSGGVFGDLLADNPITTSTWRAYLVERAATNLARSTSDFWSVDAAEIAGAFPEPEAPAFVHLDAFAGNMLTDGTVITAVIDIGTTSLAGDRRFDPVAAAVYLATPEITPMATEDEIVAAMSWLRAVGLDEWFGPVRRWLAAFWSYAVDDVDLLHWCRRVLLEEG
jgi:aminoglycoside phosphotransferase (APT) family kinase protein